MFRFLIPILVVTSSAMSLEYALQEPQKASAASAAQIRFAEENKYDDTGPGSKGPEFAYDTYKTLEDALVSFIDDPDTKLPEFERAKGIQRLFKSQQLRDKFVYNLKPSVNQLKPVLVSAFDDKNVPFNADVNSAAYQPNSLTFEGLRELQRQRLDPLKIPRFQSIKSSPMNLAHFTKDVIANNDGIKVDPNYSYSYGVHDGKTGDSKSAHEARNGGVVRGYYTFLDADGKQRTVHYTADDKQGFRAIVRRSPSQETSP